ncbi:division/cell wall cluster transcriptional repressor MraZ [uncultured Sneathiella sp.]|uniref:division/cell wall cluster transcriptional repressor MraZ n=1 Tax=uncultured Sneathiella sp. TaxID=879315 RepID=UPI00259178AC|nr:division/cell wall cluster transcriptional repressor MraZ [uncultured Sneathiella sp.]
MALFLSTYVNKVDKKGRVSVPAKFRAVLASKGFDSVVLLPTINGDAIDACGMDVMERLLEKIGGFDPLSEDRESFADALMSDAVELPIDGDGRIMVPLELLENAGIEGQCAFVGRGDSFQIWQPEAFEIRKQQARARAVQKRASSLGGEGGAND